MKRWILVLVLLLGSFSLSTEEEKIDYEKEIEELGKSIQMLKRWQSQYLKKEKSYKAHNRRVLFRGESTSDGKKSTHLAEEARLNALELQEQIDALQNRRDALIASK